MARVNEKKVSIMFVGIMIAEDNDISEVINTLDENFGNHELKYGPYEFSTPFYEKEMGKNIKKYFLSYSGDFYQPDIVKIKLKTNEIEKKFLRSENRMVNLDPGYLTEGKMVLASCKDNIQRIYLGDGVYAESTLYFKKGKYCPFEYTYADYRENYHDFFIELRKELKKIKGL